MKILITGAASGLGFNLAKELSKRKHLVYITVHSNKEVQIVRKKVEDELLKILVFKMDIRNKSDRLLIEKLDIDCLINHAGIGNGGSLLEMDISVLRDNYETNIFASFQLLQEFYKLKTKQNKKAKIFVTSSLAAYLPIRYLGCYTSSKAAITMLTLTIRKELEYLNKNISISLIEPGAYDTGFNKVMIDNKVKFLNKNSKILKNAFYINRMQRNIFTLIEKKNYNSIIKKIVKQVERDKPKLHIKAPLIQGIFVKLYNLTK